MLIITSMSARRKVSLAGKYAPVDIPYIICNITFKLDKDDDPYMWDLYMLQTQEFSRVLTIGNPEEYSKYLDGEIKEFSGTEIKWALKDPLFSYKEKFKTFHFRDYVADCSITRAVLDEIRYYTELNRFPSTYRHKNESVFLRHLKTLSEFWD